MPIGQDGRCWAESWWRSGFLHCAAHDKAVSSFGRNDGCWLRRRKQTRATATATAKATATATATATPTTTATAAAKATATTKADTRVGGGARHEREEGVEV